MPADITLVLADDHPLVLDGLANLFRMEKGLEVLSCCNDGTQAMHEIRRLKPDVAVLDIRMPGTSGLELARTIRDEVLPTKVVLFTAALEEQELIDAVSIGVQGIVVKEMAPQLLVQCIRKVHAGEQWIEKKTSRLVLEKMLKRQSEAKEVSATLTPREIDLVRMVSSGLRNREIGEKLCISEGTVKVHLHNIYEKLKVDGRMALLRYAQEKGVV